MEEREDNGNPERKLLPMQGAVAGGHSADLNGAPLRTPLPTPQPLRRGAKPSCYSALFRNKELLNKESRPEIGPGAEIGPGPSIP